jgi:hypothetical protein
MSFILQASIIYKLLSVRKSVYRSSVAVAISWKRSQQGLIQRNHSHVDDENLPGLLDPALETVLVVYEVLKRLLEDLSEECTEAFCEPPVERDVTERSAEVSMYS